jgi:hypothetical protein
MQSSSVIVDGQRYCLRHGQRHRLSPVEGQHPLNLLPGAPLPVLQVALPLWLLLLLLLLL